VALPRLQLSLLFFSLEKDRNIYTSTYIYIYIYIYCIKLSALKESSRIWCLKTHFLPLRNLQSRVIFNGEHYYCAYDT
jgi:hypothetical protein